MAISIDMMNRFENRIFQERTMIYGDIYNIIYDIVNENSVLKKLINNQLNWYVGEKEFVGTFTFSFVCCLMSLKDTMNQQELSRNFIQNFFVIIHNEYDRYDPNGWFDSLIMMFESKPTIEAMKQGLLYRLPHIINKLMDRCDMERENGGDTDKRVFNEIQDALYQFINLNEKYNVDYMYMLSLGMLAFYKSTIMMDNQRDLIRRYMESLIDLNILSDKVDLYDYPNYRGNVSY
jgi:hypothetical protein